MIVILQNPCGEVIIFLVSFYTLDLDVLRREAAHQGQAALKQ